MADSQRVVNLAVVGCGYWGPNLIRTFPQLAAANLLGLCRADPAKLRAMATDYPSARLYPHMDAVVGDDDVEAVAIATPAPTHYELSKQALLAGKHVFVEKPMTLRVHEARELTELADRRDLILMVGHLLEYAPAVRKTKELIDGGVIGRLRHIHMERLKLGKVRSEENVLWSFAPHDISVAGFLLGRDARPTSVQAVGHCYVQPHIEDIVHVDMEYPGPVTVHIYVSWLHPEGRRGATIVGEDGMLVWDDLAAQDKIVLHRKAVDPDDLSVADHGSEPVAFQDAKPLTVECEHFVDCIINGDRPISDGHDGLRVVEVLERAGRSLGARAV